MTEVALRKDLYRAGPQGPVLTGGRCTQCGHVAFPRMPLCVGCGNDSIDVADIGNQGTLFCETTVHMKTDRYAAGYTVGYVRMDHGVRVFGQIDKPDGRPLRVGERMAVGIGVLWEDGDKAITAFRFRPVDARA